MFQINWFIVYQLANVNDKKALFMSVFLDVIDKAFPIKIIKYRTNKKKTNNKWYSVELQKLKNDCLLYYDLYKNCNRTEDKQKYNELKRWYKIKLKLAKSDYYSQLINNSTNKIKTTWSVVSEQSLIFLRIFQSMLTWMQNNLMICLLITLNKSY